MTKTFLNLALAAVVSLGAVSCKDNKTTTEEAQDVAVATEMAADYTVDTEASQIMWKGNKPTGSHNGSIKIKSGTISVKDSTIEAGKFAIDMTSISSEDLQGDEKASLDAHLKGTVEGKEGDFFNVNQYPEATFELTGITQNGGTSMVNGNLTIKDKTNNIQFPATVSMEGDTVMIKSETFEIDRTKWDVNYGSKSVFDNLGDKFINDNMEITISLVATKA